ncbi:hypothetical protein PFISCL1PPCAC_27313, partial [Pristionchus fissidentatus]
RMRRAYVPPGGRMPIRTFAAPQTWQSYPNACRRVSSDVVAQFGYWEPTTLYSALIRVVRRQMTFKEASAAFEVPILSIQTAFKRVFPVMSAIIMELMDKKQKDAVLTGAEYIENPLKYSMVLEHELTTKMVGEFEFAVPIEHGVKAEEETEQPCSSKQVFVTQEVLPLVQPKEEEYYEMEKDVKEEPLDTGEYWDSNPSDYPADFSIPEFDLYEQRMNEIGEVKMEGADDEMLVIEDEPKQPESDLDRAIGMAVESSDLVGEAVFAMQEAVRDVMVRSHNLSDVIKVHGFTAQSVANMMNKTKVYYKKITRQDAPSSQPLLIPNAALRMDYIAGEPLDPADTSRILKINNTVRDIVKRSSSRMESKERLRKAVYAVCLGEMTVNAAGNKFNVPATTIHTYTYKARKALGSWLPPQAAGPALWADQIKQTDTRHNMNTLMPKNTFSLDDVDDIVADVVISNSQHDNQTKQSIFDAVISVITRATTLVDAGNATGLPPSTIGPYVHKSKAKMGLQQHTRTSRLKFLPRRRKSPKIANLVTNVPASKSEVDRLIHSMLLPMASGLRKMGIQAAVLDSVMGEKTIKEACTDEGLPASTIHPYVAKVRHQLGKRCPVPKYCVSDRAASQYYEEKERLRSDDSYINSEEVDKVTIDGITVPNSIRLLSRSLTVNRVDFSRAIPFDGTRDELRTKLGKILSAFRYKGNIAALVDAILAVYVDEKSIT